MKKLKFKPSIKKIKLNPEQAVLACTCYDWNQNIKRVAAGKGSFTASEFSTSGIGACIMNAGYRGNSALRWGQPGNDWIRLGMNNQSS